MTLSAPRRQSNTNVKSERATLFKEVDSETVIITPNARLALRLCEEYNALQTHEVWESPQIHPINHYIKSLWQALSQPATLKPLLSPMKEALAWTEVVNELSPWAVAKERLAEELQSAWTVTHAWQLELKSSLFSYNDETRFFYQAAQAFIKKTADYQPTSTLLNQLSVAIQKLSATLPKKIILAYFDDISPSLKALMTTLEDLGTTVTYFNGLSDGKNGVVATFKTPEEQLSGLIPWLKNLRAKEVTNIAIIVPDLKAKRDEVAYQLTQHFPIEDINFSQGYPLPHYGIVAAALHLLQIKTKWLLTHEDCHFLLLNPFLKTSNYQEQSHQLLIKIKTSGETHLSQNQLINLLGNDELKTCLKDFFKKTIKGEQSLEIWQAHFHTIFKHLGFAENTLSSPEYQTLNKLYETLEHFRTLQAPDKAISYQQAITLFKWLCAKTTFQPESNNEPIQVLGLIEALGQSFNAAWVLDMTADTLPQKTNPSPFIPLYLQRKLQMPKASDQREINYAKQIIQRLKTTAPQVVFSYYTTREDEITLISPLIAELPKQSFPTHQHSASIDVEFYKPHYQVKPALATNIRGGSFLLKEQAVCPFRAFAQFRLNLKEAKKTQEGLDELDRGTLIHLVLEYFWQKTTSQQQLLAYSDKELHETIENAATKAVTKLKKERPLTMTDDFSTREIERLIKLTQKLLDIEKSRPPFEVSSVEKKQTYQIAGVDLSLRVDRIDTLEHGGKAVIDYKTGSPSVESWFSDCIDEPQLPLYSLGDNDITALMYVILKHHEVKFKGFDASENDLKGLKPLSKYTGESFVELKEKWLHRFTETMQDFLDGKIAATPNKKTRCNTCHVKSLCGKLYEN